MRFVQVYSDGEWDAHSRSRRQSLGPLPGDRRADRTDCSPTSSSRGLIDSTLVIWGGEFGRMPVSQGKDGRDHNPQGFIAWMAGAGIKGGTSHGETDEIGYRASGRPGVGPRPARHDAAPAWASITNSSRILHNGRSYRLTDVAGNVLTTVLA